MYRVNIRVLGFLLLGSGGLFLLSPHQDTINQLELWSEPYCYETTRLEIKPIDDWTLEEMLDYVKWTNRSACTLTNDFGGVIVKSIGLRGQKSICLDESVRPERSAGGLPMPFFVNLSAECLAYSFGINNEWSFEKTIETLGCRVFSFDPFMDKGTYNHTNKIHFYNVGLQDRDGILFNNKSKTPKNSTMMSLDSIYRNLLRHEGRIIDYLKIDIEDSEWAVLPQIISSGMMDKVRQLAVTVHLLPEKENCELNEIRKRVKIIKSLEDYGLVRFDSKFSPWSRKRKIIDNVVWEGYCTYEIAWYSTKIVRDLTPINIKKQ